MKTKTRVLAVVLALVPVYVLSTGNANQPQTPSQDQSSPIDKARVERGRHLVTVSLCHDCHSPKRVTDDGRVVLDEARLLSGHPEADAVQSGPVADSFWTAASNDHFTAWYGAWGITFARNLTSDLETGLGGWTEGMFLKAMRTGRHMGEGRAILPPMPWESFAQLSDQDLKDIFAFLQTVPAVSNAVPEAIPPERAQRTTP